MRRGRVAETVGGSAMEWLSYVLVGAMSVGGVYAGASIYYNARLKRNVLRGES